MKTSNLIVVLILVFGIMLSCSQSSSEKNPGKGLTDTTKKDTLIKKNEVFSLKFDSIYDQTAAFIAGMNFDMSKLHGQVDTVKYWNHFKYTLDTIWAKLDTERFSKMKQWAGLELIKENGSQRVLFYPFSGPDFYNCFTFFPNAKNYIFIALEPIGDLPKVKDFKKKSAENYINSVKTSLNDLFKRSYFITSRMGADLQRDRVNGALPLISLFIKRTGNTITNIQRVGIDSTGICILIDSMPKKKVYARGVKIDFWTGKGNDLRSVYYFSTDISNAGLMENRWFNKYLQKLDTCHTYLKSASYLMHGRDFSMIRNIVFEKSDCILQDDSGIAYRYFDKQKWKIQLYGAYEKPIKDFPYIKEPELEKAYATDTTIKPMPFSLGYRWSSKKTNLLKATKK